MATGRAPPPLRRCPVVLIGLGGADPALVQRFVGEGRMPHLRRLLARGESRTLRSAPNAVSECGWSSLATGLNPGRHGVFYPLDRVPGTYDLRPVSADWRDGVSFWRLASDAGRRVAVLNAPLAYPAEEVQGIFTCGAAAPAVEAAGYAWPPELAARTRVVAPDFVLHPAEGGDLPPDVLLNRHVLSVRAKARIAQQLLEDEPYDFVAVFCDEITPVQELLWHHFDGEHLEHTAEGRQAFGGAIPRLYSAVDEALGAVAEVIPGDATLLVVSEHGVTRNSRGPLYLKALLRALALEVPAAPEGSVVRRARRAAREALARLAGGRLLADTAVDYQRSRAWTEWCDGWSEPWINVRGRDPEGIVAERGGEYARLAEQLRELLLGLRDTRTAQLVVQSVALKEELYTGAHLLRAPDLTIRWKDATVVSGLRAGEAVGDLAASTDRRTGVPRPEGLLVAVGLPAAAGRLRAEPSLVDVAPTVLRLLGVGGAEAMDGVGLTE